MAYTKPQVIAQNASSGSYAAGCPSNIRNLGSSTCNTQRKKRFFEAITHLVKNHAMCKSFAHSVFLFMAASSIQV